MQYVKENPKKIKYGTTGVGTSQHMAMECIAIKDKVQWVHVPHLDTKESLARY